MQALTSLLRRPGPRAGAVLPSSAAAEEKHRPRIKSGVTFAFLAALFATPASASTGAPVNPWVALAYLAAARARAADLIAFDADKAEARRLLARIDASIAYIKQNPAQRTRK